MSLNTTPSQGSALLDGAQRARWACAFESRLLSISA